MIPLSRSGPIAPVMHRQIRSQILPGDQNPAGVRIIVDRHLIRQRQIDTHHVRQSGTKAPHHDFGRNGVASLSHPARDAVERQVGRWQPQKHQRQPPAFRPALAQQPLIGAPRTRRLEREARALRDQRMDARQHGASGCERSLLGTQRRQATRDLVGVDELADADPWQKDPGGRRLPGAVRTADEDDLPHPASARPWLNWRSASRA